MAINYKPAEVRHKIVNSYLDKAPAMTSLHDGFLISLATELLLIQSINFDFCPTSVLIFCKINTLVRIVRRLERLVISNNLAISLIVDRHNAVVTAATRRTYWGYRL